MSAVRYEQESCWEVIHATKEKLQSFGIGAGLAFPGEGRAPKELRTLDPRGYETLIERGEDGCFQALIFYPRPKATHNGFVSPHIDGLEPAQDNGPYGDAYTGSAAAIVVAGLARLDQIPGQAGAAKVQVCILPDGSIPTGRSDHRRNEPGAVVIKRNGKSVYRIFIRTTKLEMKRREKIQHDAYLFDQYQQSRMPEPAILLAVHRELKQLAAATATNAEAESILHNAFLLRAAGEA